MLDGLPIASNRLGTNRNGDESSSSQPLDLQRALMYGGIGVLMKRGRFSIGKLPDMRERGFEAFPCCLVRAAVLTQGHDSRTIGHEFVWNGRVTIPIAAELHEHVFQNGLWPRKDATVWPALSLTAVFRLIEKHTS